MCEGGGGKGALMSNPDIRGFLILVCFTGLQTRPRCVLVSGAW